MEPIAFAKISTPTQPCPLQKSPKNLRHPSPSSQVKPTTGAPAVRANLNPFVTDLTRAPTSPPFPTPPKKTAPCISAPANKAPTASSAMVRTKHCPDSTDAASRLKNGPCEDDGPPKITTRAAALNLGVSTFALFAPLLAAPSGPSAMCFLRPAQGFGWLDPRLNCSASTRPTPITTRTATQAKQARSLWSWTRASVRKALGDRR
jgi:hypothetical protein